MPSNREVLDAYRRAYDNQAYKDLSRAIAHQLGLTSSDYTMVKNIREQSHNVVMNWILDACMERCGEETYRGRNGTVQVIACILGPQIYAQILAYLALFGPLPEHYAQYHRD